MLTSRRRSLFTCASLLAALTTAPIHAGAQPTLNGATLFRTNAAGNANINGGPVFAAWRTSDGVSGSTLAEFYLRNRAESDPTGTFFGNTGPNFLQIPLTAGTNQFWFYANGDDARNTGSFFGLNLFFGTGAVATAAAPTISAQTSLGGGFGAISAGQSTVLGNSTFGPGAGTLSFTSGIWTIVLSDFRLLAEQRQGSTINRVDYFNPTADNLTDNYGTFTLTVTNNASVVPEPSTWALMGTGLFALGVVSRRRRSIA